ncbi:MAG: hypothetical protein WAK15_02815, partial [Candidatus Cybelea sp.]
VPSALPSVVPPISQHEYQGEIKLAVTSALLPYLNIENSFLMSSYGNEPLQHDVLPRTLDETFKGPPEPGQSTALRWSVSMHCVNHTPPLGV